MGRYSGLYTGRYGATVIPSVPALRRLLGIGGAAVRLPLAKPGPTNTGVRGDYSSLSSSGPLTITTSGTVLEKLDVAGQIVVRADNVTIRAGRIQLLPGTSGYAIHWDTVPATGQPPVGLVIKDVEVDGNGTQGADVGPYPSGSAPSAAIEPGIGYTMRCCDVHGTVDGLKPQDNPAGQPILIEDSWVHDLVHYYTAAGVAVHNDVLQIAGSGAHDLVIRRNFLDGNRAGGNYASSSLIQWGSFPGNAGVLTDIAIEDNWVEGGGYASRLDAVGLAICQRVGIRRNRFGLRHNFGIFTGTTVSADGGTIETSGNVWDVTGETDFGLSVSAGELI